MSTRSPRNRRRRRPPAAGGRAPARRARQPRRDRGHQGGERLRRVAAATARSRSARRTRSGSTATTAASSPATSCASTACARGCWSPPRRRGSESVHELTNPALPLPGGRVLPLQSLQLRLERRIVGDDEIEETLLVHSYDREPLYLDLDLLLAADFEPMLAIRGILATGAGRAGRRRAARATACASRSAAVTAVHRALTVTADRPSSPATRRHELRFALCLRAGRRGDDHAALRAARGRRPRRRATPPRPTATRRASDAWLADAHGRGDGRRALQPRPAALPARHPDAALAPRRRRLLRGRRAVVRDAVRPRLADHGDAAARLRPRRWPRRRCACWPG